MRRKPKVRKTRVEKPADGQAVHYHFGSQWWTGYFERNEWGGAFYSRYGFLHVSDVSRWRPRNRRPNEAIDREG